MVKKLTSEACLIQVTGTQPFCSVNRKVISPCNKKSRYVAHQIVIHPETAHCIVYSRENPHRGLVRIVIRNILIHGEQVPVFGFYNSFPIALDRISEIKIDSQAGGPYSYSLIGDQFVIS